MKVLKELFITDSQLGYIGTEFIDGKLIRTEAVKVLQMNEETE